MVFGKYFDCLMFSYLVCRFVTVLWMLLGVVIQYLSFLMGSFGSRLISFHSASRLLWLPIVPSLFREAVSLPAVDEMTPWVCAARIRNINILLGLSRLVCSCIDDILLGCFIVQHNRTEEKKKSSSKYPFCVRVGKNNK